MAKYKLTGPVFVNDTYHNEGEIINFDGRPNGNMIPLDDAAKKAKAKAPPSVDPILALTEPVKKPEVIEEVSDGPEEEISDEETLIEEEPVVKKKGK